MSLRKLKEQVKALQSQLKTISEEIDTLIANDNAAFRTIDHVPKVFITVKDKNNIVKYIFSARWYYRTWSTSSCRFCTLMGSSESDVLNAINHADVVYEQKNRESVHALPDDFLLFSSVLEQNEDTVLLLSYDCALSIYNLFAFKNDGFEAKPFKSMSRLAAHQYIKSYNYLYPLIHVRVTE